MKTSLATIAITATSIVLGLTPTAGAMIPDPDPLFSPPQHTETSYPFDAGSSPVQHVAGQDWLPARRVG